MDLYIRSQDRKELRPQPKLGIDKLENKYYIVDRYNFESAIILGVYETEERALEVLDEIQDKIVINYGYELATNSGIRPDNIKSKSYTAIYEMPQD